MNELKIFENIFLIDQDQLKEKFLIDYLVFVNKTDVLFVYTNEEN